jgi:hypothetical protein
MSLFSLGSWQCELSAFSAQCNVSVLSFQSDGGILGRRTDGPLSRLPSTPVSVALVAVTLAAVARDLRRRPRVASPGRIR